MLLVSLAISTASTGAKLLDTCNTEPTEKVSEHMVDVAQLVKLIAMSEECIGKLSANGQCYGVNHLQEKLVTGATLGHKTKQKRPGHKARSCAFPRSAVKAMAATFEKEKFPSRAMKTKISKEHGMTMHQINIWFANKRARSAW